MNKEEQRAYNKAYYESNKEKKKTYYKDNKEKRNAYNNAYKQAHKEVVKAYREARKKETNINYKIYYQENKKEIKVNKKAYYEAHKEETRERHRAYRQSNPDKIRAYRNQRRAVEASVINKPIRPNFELFLKEVYYNKCAYCRKTNNIYHLDHFMPLKRGGHNAEYNLVLSCPDCNFSKQAQHPQDWLKEMEYSFTKPDYMLEYKP